MKRIGRIGLVELIGVIGFMLVAVSGWGATQTTTNLVLMPGVTNLNSNDVFWVVRTNASATNMSSAKIRLEDLAGAVAKQSAVSNLVAGDVFLKEALFAQTATIYINKIYAGSTHFATFTLTNGYAEIGNTNFNGIPLILLTAQSWSANAGSLSVSNIVVGEKFTVKSSNAADDRTVAYWMIYAGD